MSTFFTIFLYLVFGLLLGKIKNDCQKIGSNEKFCIIFYEKPENWKDAIITCVDRKSELYVPYNDYESQQIQEISKAYQSDYIWINAYDESLSKDWHHHFNRYPVKYQGCFRNVANVTFQSSYENMNANECVNICREKYIYALFTDDEKCYCNSAYNNYMASDNCHDCQNLDECFRLYNTNGIPAKWESGQPNNYEGRQNCGAIVLTKFEAALVGDYYCNEKFRYICRKKTGNCKNGDLTKNCIYISRIGEIANWYDANLNCQSKGYDSLIYYENDTERMQLVNITLSYNENQYNEYCNDISCKFWYDITKESVKKYSGKINYTRWGLDKPESQDSKCVTLKTYKGAYWRYMDCNKKLNFYCRKNGKIQTRFDFSVVKMNTTKVSYMELPYYIKDDFENFVKQNHSDVYVSTGDIEYIESPAKFYFVLYTTEIIVNTIVDQIYVKIISHAIENYYVNLERLSLDSIKNDTSIQSKPSMKNEKTDIVKLNQNESNKKNPIIKAKKVNKANDVELKQNENLKKTISNKKITIIDPLKTKTKTYTLITEPPKKIVIEKKINHINKIKNEYKFSSPFKTSTKTVSLKFQQTLPNNFNNNTVELKNRTNVQNVSTNNTEKFNLTHQNDFISQEPSIGVMVNQFGYYKIITIVLIFMVTLLMLFSGLFIAYAIRSRNLQINPATLKTDTVNDDDKEIEKV